jgi:hypothetical protein
MAGNYSDRAWDKSVDDTRHWLLEPTRFKHVTPRYLIDNKKMFDIIQDQLHDIYSGATGTVESPTRTSHDDSDPYVEVRGSYGSWSFDKNDIEEFLDKWFPVPPKPINPLKQKQQILPTMVKQVADAYQAEMEVYLAASWARKEFNKQVFVDLEKMSDGPWEDSYVYISDLEVEWQNDPADAIRDYGRPD